MNLHDFNHWVKHGWIDKRGEETVRYAGDNDHESSDHKLRDLAIMTLGLVGESGETSEHIKKFIRDGVLDRHKLMLELGDVLHYWTRICVEFEIDPEDVMYLNFDKIEARRAAKVGPHAVRI